VTLDLIGDVRDDLYRPAQEIAATLSGDDFSIDAPAGDVGILPELHIGKALIVAQIEIGLCTILEHKDFTVLERRHGAGVHVDVGIELLERDAHATRL